MSQEERMMILQMVSEKKVTPAEAAELLRAMEGGTQAVSPPQTHKTPPPAGAPRTLRPPTPPTASRSSSDGGFSASLGSFIEDLVDRVTAVFGESTGNTYEFPTEVTGEFIGDQIPLRIITGNGRVVIHTWDQPGYKAAILVKARGVDEAEARSRAEEAYDIRADEHGFDLESRRSLTGAVSVYVTLLVPAQKRYQLEARSGNGKVELADLLLVEGRVTSGNGRISFLGGKAEQLDLRSGNGAIEAVGDIGNLEAESGNGSVTITPTGRRPQSLRLATGNGSVKVITNRLDPAAGFRVEAHTGLGSVGVDLPSLRYERDVRSVGHKHVIAQSENFAESEARVSIVARTGLGSVSIG